MTRTQVLLVDDDAIQLKLTSLRLREAGYDVVTATGGSEALDLVRRQPPDAIVSDVLMGDIDGFTLCRMLREQSALDGVPVILLSSHYKDDPDQVLATRVGAQALLPRTADFEREIAAVRRHLRSHCRSVTTPPDAEVYEQHLKSHANQITKLLGQARSAEERYRALFLTATEAISVLSTDGIVLDANPRWQHVIGIDPVDMIGRHVREFAAPGYEEHIAVEYASSVTEGGAMRTEVPLRHADGSTVYMDFSSTMIEEDGRTLVFTIGRDVTRAVIDARALAAAEAKYRTLLERIPDVIWTATIDGRIVFVTPNVTRVLGFTPEEMCAEDLPTRLKHTHPDDRDAVRAAFHEFVTSGTSFDVEYRRKTKDGRWIWVHSRAIGAYERDGVRYFEGMISDVTERKQLEESLRQAQKMEAIGQLTGGIAHDFNNLLAAILGNSHFLLEELADNDPRHADALDIKTAAERAAALTRQLLAFSRRQVLEPTAVDLDAAIGGLEKMLRRLIGEDIDFSVVKTPGLHTVRVDVGQIEQVIVNLVVNARDAMPTGGKLAIATANVDFAAPMSLDDTTIPPGSYAMFSVADSGCGMDPATLRRIFEPFFTTKEVGKGTGLGLSTCYGIVKQSGGYIWVRSEVDRGTTFEIYLPRDTGARIERTRRTGKIEVRGEETILLVEDDDRVRVAIGRMLTNHGYHVIAARDGGEAISIAENHTIDLVVSDVIMPGLSGPEVVDRVRKISPHASALFMSGYTDHEVLRNGVLQDEFNFIQKPFAPATLAKKVRDVLDARLAT
jgi:PAS domain S-box-containing protein